MEVKEKLQRRMTKSAEVAILETCIAIVMIAFYAFTRIKIPYQIIVTMIIILAVSWLVFQVNGNKLVKITKLERKEKYGKDERVFQEHPGLERVRQSKTAERVS